VDTSNPTFIGIDLGGARGKTTAVARVRAEDGAAVVEEVNTRHRGGRNEQSWTDEVLVAYVTKHTDPDTVVAVNAALTQPACVRCTLDVCPGEAVCSDTAVMWLREHGAAMLEETIACDRDRIAAIPTGGATRGLSVSPPTSRPRLAPYVHRCTEVVLHFERDLIPRGQLSRGTGPVTARASQLRRRFAGLGYQLNRNLLEVSPRATVHALFGSRMARGYKRDADPWRTRAAVIEGLADLRFARSSRMSKEDVLGNDHCFEALLSAYTAWLAHRDGWTMPDDGPFDEDGFIWVPDDAK
jgi:hypothetical protein